MAEDAGLNSVQSGFESQEGYCSKHGDVRLSVKTQGCELCKTGSIPVRHPLVVHMEGLPSQQGEQGAALALASPVCYHTFMDMYDELPEEVGTELRRRNKERLAELDAKTSERQARISQVAGPYSSAVVAPVLYAGGPRFES